MAKHHVTATLNGNAVEFLCETQQTLLEVLRDELQLTGTKEGCGTGDCGACSVTVGGRLVCSCLVLGVEAQGKAIETIDGMAECTNLHPLQRKFLRQAILKDPKHSLQSPPGLAVNTQQSSGSPTGSLPDQTASDGVYQP